MVWRFTAGTTGKRVQTSAWQSIRQLWTVDFPWLDDPLDRRSWKVNSVALRVMARITDRQDCDSRLRPIRWMLLRWTMDVRSAVLISTGKLGSWTEIPLVDANVDQW